MTIATAKLSSKRHLTLPAALRDILGVDAGSVVVFSRDKKTNKIIIERAQTIDENTKYFTSLIKPGVKPVKDVHSYVAENYDGRL